MQYAQIMAHFHIQSISILYSILLIIFSECRGNIYPHANEVMSATPGEDAVLPCSLPANTGPEICHRIKLTKHAANRHSQPEVIFARPKTSKFPDGEHVQWRAKGNGDMSISLTKVSKSDEGLYSCEIWRGWDCIAAKNISLKVKDCKVLEQVKASPGTSATLYCPLNTTSGQHQNLSWSEVKGGIEHPITSDSDIYGLEVAGKLVIRSAEFGQWYRCKYLVGQSQRCFDMRLIKEEEAVITTVDPVDVTENVQAVTSSEELRRDEQEGSDGVSTGIMVASIIFGIASMIVLIIVLVIFLRRHTHRFRQHTQRQPGVHMQVNDDNHDNAHFIASADLRTNSIYESFPDEGLCTFQC